MLRHDDITWVDSREFDEHLPPPAGQPPGSNHRQIPDKAHGRAMAAEIVNQRLVSPDVDSIRGGRMALEVINHAHHVAKIFRRAGPGIAGVELRRTLPPLVEGPVVRYDSHHRTRQEDGN